MSRFNSVCIRILKVKFHLRREWTIFIKRWSNCIRNYPINLGRKRGNTYEVVESDSIKVKIMRQFVFWNCLFFCKYFKSCKFEKAVAGGGCNFAGLFEEY